MDTTCKLCKVDGQLEHLNDSLFCGACKFAYKEHEDGTIDLWITQHTQLPDGPVIIDKTRVKFYGATEETSRTVPKGKNHGNEPV